MASIVYGLLRACDAMEAAGLSERHIRAVFTGAEEVARLQAEEHGRDGRAASLALRTFQDAVAVAYEALRSDVDAAAAGVGKIGATGIRRPVI